MVAQAEQLVPPCAFPFITMLYNFHNLALLKETVVAWL